jgi:TolB-like protein/class 3 adenylate cyclase/Flp pilus assembly protein TadD
LNGQTKKEARSLAAVMFTDLAGYTALMEMDEQQAHDVVGKLKSIQKEAVSNFNGKIIKYIGDGTLITFSSAFDAVNCAIDIQKELLKESKIHLRIGIHLGEVVEENGDVYGDSVNVASRVENQAIPGSILITDKVYDEIKNHPELKTLFLGIFTLKNITQPVGIYAITTPGLRIPDTGEPEKKEPISDDKGLPIFYNLKLPGRKLRRTLAIVFWIALLAFIVVAVVMDRKEKILEKSIAVLPFENLSDDETQEFFSDGITDDILLHLHKIGDFKVTSRTSAMKYKNVEKSIGEIGKELGVNYILEGSVRKEGDHVKVTAQLINARDDEHIWGEWYNAELTKIFDIQSDIASKIASALKTELTRKETRQISKIPTSNLQAYEFYLRGREYYFNYSPEANDIAIDLYHEAIGLDTSFALAYAGLGNAYARKGYYTFEMKWLDSARTACEKSIHLDSALAEGYKGLAMVYDLTGDKVNAIHYGLKAVAINPNYIQALHNLGVAYMETGRLDMAVEFYNKASNLDPDKSSHLDNYGEIYYMLDEEEKAVMVFQQSMKLIPDNIYSLLFLYKIYSIGKNLDETEEISMAIMNITGNQNEHYIRMMAACLISGNLEQSGAWVEKLLAASPMKDDSDFSEWRPTSNLLTINYLNSALYLSHYFALAGEKEKANGIRNHQLSFYQNMYKDGNRRIRVLRNLAYAHSLAGSKDSALYWLDLAVRSGWREYRQELVNPLFDAIRETEEFKELTRIMKSEVWQVKPSALKDLDRIMDTFALMAEP